MSMLPIEPKVYDDGRTKQAFKDETDINRILARAQISGSLSHLEKYGGQYGDFSMFDFADAQNRIAKAKEIFEALPAEIRREFGQSPNAFFAFANDPANVDRLATLLPEIAEPQDFRLDLRPKVAEVVEAAEPEIPPVDPPVPVVEEGGGGS